MPFKNVAERAAELLAGLGETPDEIAAMLRGAGYKGVRGNGMECPCGSCLRDHLGTPVRVGSYISAPRRGSIALIPKHVDAFICEFDAGAYPDLDLDLERTK